MNNQIRFLDNDALARLAPSVLASHPHKDVSDKYSFLPTLAVVDALREGGFFPVRASQSLVHVSDRQGFQKHVIRFRRDAQLLSVGDVIPELVLVNSSDGKSSYQLHAGLYRCICRNQCTVSDTLFETIRLRHVGLTRNDVIEASYRIVEDLPKLTESVQEMKAIVLNADERKAFAESALMLKYDSELAPIPADGLLRIRRMEDRNHDLFSTMNVIQENIIRGGLRGLSVGSDGRLRHTRTRSVKSLSEDIRLNKSLWALAEKMKAIKTDASALSLAA